MIKEERRKEVRRERMQGKNTSSTVVSEVKSRSYTNRPERHTHTSTHRQIGRERVIGLEEEMVRDRTRSELFPCLG